MKLMNDISDCYIPDETNKHNYVIDTCVFDKKLATDENSVAHFCSMIPKGYCYFYTTAQQREIKGIQDRKGDYTALSPSGNMQKILDVIEALSVKRISCCTVFYPDFMLLDGTFRFLEETGENATRYAMTMAIDNNNNNHRKDAIIAEATIYNKCKLITTDRRLLNKVNHYFPGCAVHFDEFILRLKTIEREVSDET